MGVHTGDSITVAPAQTLTDKVGSQGVGWRVGAGADLGPAASRGGCGGRRPRPGQLGARSGALPAWRPALRVAARSSSMAGPAGVDLAHGAEHKGTARMTQWYC